MDTSLERYGSWSAAWAALKHETNLDPAREWERLMKRGVRLILKGDGAYPEELAQIPNAPHALYVLGDISCAKPTLAIVGTRRATDAGRATARKFAHDIARHGNAIVSGLAFGIDYEAHRGALEARGRTIAVLPAGLDAIYPTTHRPLAETIVKNGGALVSEYPFGTPPLPFRFLERNRIVSGLSAATLVVEAPTRSGALVTARRALEQNREVFAVCGDISSRNHAGCHALIKDGASLATEPADLFLALHILLTNAGQLALPACRALDPHEAVVMGAIRQAGKPLDIDTIAELTTLEARVISSAIAMLVVDAMLIETERGYSLA